MSLSPARQRDLFALLHTLRDAELSAEQSGKLREFILSDDDALALYLDHAYLLARLRWAHDGCGEVAAELFSPDQRASVGRLPKLARLMPRLIAVAASLALVAYFVALAALLVWDRFHRVDEPPQLAAQQSNEPPARLVDADDSSWDQPSNAAGDQLQTLRVRSGLAHLKFAQGAEVVVEGPAEFEVRSSNRGFLRRGRLMAKVPPPAIGFTIETATAKVVDLGTEFGVEANEHGETEVNVLLGRVSLQPVARAGLSATEAFVVRAGEAKRIRVDGTVDVTIVDTAGNWNRLANVLPKQRVERQVFPEGLVSYWALDESDVSIQDSLGISHGEARRGQRVAGLIGRGALKSGETRGQLAEIYDGESAGTFSQALSIEAMFVSSWSGKPGDYDFICRKQQGTLDLVSLAFKNDKGPAIVFEIETDAGRHTLNLTLDGRAGHPSLRSLTNGKPHHMVATFDGLSGEMAIYVDGVQRIHRSIGPSQLLEDSNQLSEKAAAHVDDPFSGVLDEIAVYRVALTSRDVAAHWKNVSQGRSYFAKP